MTAGDLVGVLKDGSAPPTFAFGGILVHVRRRVYCCAGSLHQTPWPFGQDLHQAQTELSVIGEPELAAVRLEGIRNGLTSSSSHSCRYSCRMFQSVQGGAGDLCRAKLVPVLGHTKALDRGEGKLVRR